MKTSYLFGIGAAAALVVGSVAWNALQENAASAPAPPTLDQIAFAETATPSDAELAAVYDRSCRACHALDGGGAPLTGHAADWRARAEERGGLRALTVSAIEGYENMPGMGLCNDCSEGQIVDLIEFMIGEEL
ncbi:c-type cytochrome [Yoonia sp. SS1-5]|uniref:Cytochrome c5 family protein n=1 Tax=Yoonia rhodophyticola TaxID=3137370 RepID=A0AAN0M9N8_9RHOB